MVFCPDRAVASGSFCLCGNKKGPQEAPCAPLVVGWQSATPGGAPGYDGDKEFGNNITHARRLASQRLREHSGQTDNVKAGAVRSTTSLARFRAFGEGKLLQSLKKRVMAAPKRARLVIAGCARRAGVTRYIALM